jgi:hypothetical protein
LQDDLRDETDARVDKDDKLDGRLQTAESSIRTLQDDLRDETDARVDKDDKLDGRLQTAESSIRTLQTDLSTKASEIATSVTEAVNSTIDGKISDAVSTEASRATQSEEQIAQSVGAAEDRLNSRIDAEASDRKTADSALINFLQDKPVYANRDALPNVTPDAAGHTWQTGDVAVIFTGTSVVLVVADVADSIVTWH